MANKPLCGVDTINSVTANDKIFVNVNGTIKQSKMSDIPSIIQLGNAQGNLTHGCMNAGVYKVLGTEDGHPVPGQAGVMTVLNDGNNGKYKSLALVNGQTYTMNQDEAGTVLVNWRCVEKDLDELNNSLANNCKKPKWDKTIYRDTTFTATEDCYVSVFCRSGSGVRCEVTINNNKICSTNLDGSVDYGTTTPFFYIPKGKTIGYTTSDIAYESYFVIINTI